MDHKLWSCSPTLDWALLNIEMATLPYLSNKLSPTHHQSTEIFSPSPQMNNFEMCLKVTCGSYALD